LVVVVPPEIEPLAAEALVTAFFVVVFAATAFLAIVVVVVAPPLTGAVADPLPEPGDVATAGAPGGAGGGEPLVTPHVGVVCPA